MNPITIQLPESFKSLKGSKDFEQALAESYDLNYQWQERYSNMTGPEYGDPEGVSHAFKIVMEIAHSAWEYLLKPYLIEKAFSTLFRQVEKLQVLNPEAEIGLIEQCYDDIVIKFWLNGVQMGAVSAVFAEIGKHLNQMRLANAGSPSIIAIPVFFDAGDWNFRKPIGEVNIANYRRHWGLEYNHGGRCVYVVFSSTITHAVWHE